MNALLLSLRNFFARKGPTLEEQYLASAVDLIDLEHRMRQLDSQRSFNTGAFTLATLLR